MSKEAMVPYRVMSLQTEDISRAIKENLMGEALNPGDLPRYKVPSGGGKMWQPDDDELEPLKELEGVIIHQHFMRMFYVKGIDEGGGGERPDCFSRDGVTGEGDPGGTCDECPMSKFGPLGEVPKCQLRRQLFLLLPESTLPTVVSIPPASLKYAKRYLVALTSKGVPYWECVSKLLLASERNAQGVDFSRVVFKGVRKLEPDEVEKIRAYRQSFEPELAA